MKVKENKPIITEKKCKELELNQKEKAAIMQTVEILKKINSKVEYTETIIIDGYASCEGIETLQAEYTLESLIAL